eukprot:TRINITY_DN6863_c0_g1_i1.p1 TRINITY_DN6863_c0_g1~~TRINITY_DN6863_c0_g1_i1.p1  ORF type:complete len:464 (+),score=58.20 TRINITY_DN6863_c0_g1_i1:205-1596(+)
MQRVLALLVPVACWAGNPIGRIQGLADVHLHHMNGAFYAWATHDYSVNNTGFVMKDWWVWSSPDLVSWTLTSVVDPRRVLAWSTPATADECWATDAAVRDGRYYFYLSVGPEQVGVVVADDPTGPWNDPLGKPLLDRAMGSALSPPTTFRDPCVFEDTDGEFYIIAGVFNYYIARLSRNMVALAEPLRHIVVEHPFGPLGLNRTDDKAFVHKQGGVYYLSWGCFYARSASLYGPYVMVGAAIDSAALAPDFRIGNATVQPWYLREDYVDRHGSFLEANGQWYFACNDRSHSHDKASPASFRDTVVGYVHFRANGTIAPVAIDAQGVNAHDARSIIDAENFFEASAGAVKVDQTARPSGGAGFAVSLVRGAAVTYRNVRGLGPHLRLRIAAGPGGGGAAEIIFSADGDAGRCAVTVPALERDGYTEVTCAALPVITEVRKELVIALAAGSAAPAVLIDSFTAAL